MGIDCCDPLDLKREICKQCPHFTNCNSITTEEIKEVLEEDKDNINNKIIGGRDKRESL